MKNTLLAILCFCSCALYAQKQDYIWLAGYESASGYDTGWHHWFGISKFDFNQQPIIPVRDSLGIYFSRSNSTISDDAGDNILFYSNGLEIRNSLDEVVENGDSLSCIDDKWFFTYYGIPAAAQYHLVLPNPIYQYRYDFFHCFIDSLNIPNGITVIGKKLLRSTLDMSLNASHGSVIEKNNTIISDKNNISIAADRHANGRDWWICVNKTNTNCYNVALFDGSDSLKKFTRCDGVASTIEDFVPLRFSPDGAYFASSVSSEGAINIFNFDRCTGELVLRESFVIPELRDSFQWWATSLEFSPNSRYLYVFSTTRIYQYDLWSSPIEASKRVIAMYDPNFGCPFGQTFFHAQLAPNGKIYISSGNGAYCASVIDRPDEAGDSCHFILDYELPTFIDGLPYYPNYRLGALAGSACDTLTAINDIAEKEKLLKVFPNPATDAVTIDYGYTNWEKGDVDLEITNAAGQIVYTQPLPMYSGFQRLDVAAYAAGAYAVTIKRGNTIVATSQFMKK